VSREYILMLPEGCIHSETFSELHVMEVYVVSSAYMYSPVFAYTILMH
jgi:hypothetical protein